MANLAALSGSVRVGLRLDAGCIQSVDVNLQRPLAAVRQWVLGQSFEQFLATLPLAFSLCAAAHRVAAVEALERAMGWQAPVEVEQARQQWVALERIKETAIRLVHTWQLPWPMAALKQLLSLCTDASQSLAAVASLKAAQAPTSAGAWIVPITQLCAQLFGQVSVDWLRQQTYQYCYKEGHVQTWPDVLRLQAADWQLLLPQLRAGCFKAELAGQPKATGPASCVCGADPETDPIQQRLRALLEHLQEDVACLTRPMRAWKSPVDLEPYEGIAVVRTTRGLLLHRVCLQGTQLSDWQTIAPTDWNFHTKGLLKAQLEGLKVPEDSQEAERWINALIQSIDPCVAVQLVWEKADA